MQRERLIESILGERCPHAVLITGPEGSGRYALARRGAAAFCLGRDDPAGLESCPNYHELPEPLPVKEFRVWLSQTSMTGFNGGRRAFLIPNAHRMNPQTQNAMLKTLEEPPRDTLLLLTGTEMGLLPTIRSRAAIFRLGAEDEAAVAARLAAAGVPSDAAQASAALADGVYGLAAAYATEDAQAFRAEALGLFSRALFQSSPFQDAGKLLASDKKKADPERLAALLAVWRSAARDALVQKTGGAAVKSPEPLPGKIAARFTLTQIQGIIEGITDAEKRLSFNANPALTLDTLLARLYSKERDT